MLPKIRFSKTGRRAEFYIGFTTFVSTWGAIIVRADSFQDAYAFGWMPAVGAAILAVFVWQIKLIFTGAIVFLAILGLYNYFR
jgi:hypothetical protein